VSQLSAVPNEADQTVTLFALGNDGTVWFKLKVTKSVLHNPDASEGPWTEIGALPQ
jgi:hypothetical protein